MHEGAATNTQVSRKQALPKDQVLKNLVIELLNANGQILHPDTVSIKPMSGGGYAARLPNQANSESLEAIGISKSKSTEGAIFVLDNDAIRKLAEAVAEKREGETVPTRTRPVRVAVKMEIILRELGLSEPAHAR